MYIEAYKTQEIELKIYFTRKVFSIIIFLFQFSEKFNKSNVTLLPEIIKKKNLTPDGKRNFSEKNSRGFLLF